MLQYSIRASRPGTPNITGKRRRRSSRVCFAAATRGRRRVTRPVSPIIAAPSAGLANWLTIRKFRAFLAEVERRAFKQAMFAVRDEDAALDIVQDAMLKLTEKYSDKPAAELPMLFQRILQNTIHDHFRRQKVARPGPRCCRRSGTGTTRTTITIRWKLCSAQNRLQRAGRPGRAARAEPDRRMIEQALARLPARQREAFLLRYWEELDVAETAAAMGCSEGSVKTHCSRAVHALAEMLKAKGITL